MLPSPQPEQNPSDFPSLRVETDRNLSLARRLPQILKPFSSFLEPSTNSKKPLPATNFSLKTSRKLAKNSIFSNNFGNDSLISAEKVSETPKKSCIFRNFLGEAASPAKNRQPFTQTFKSKAYKLVSQLFLVKKFIKILRKTANLRTPNRYLLEKLDILQDLVFFKQGFAASHSEDRTNSTKSRICAIFRAGFKGFCEKTASFAKKHAKTVDPDCFFKSFWDSLHLFVLSFYFFKIPVEMSFNVDIFAVLRDESEIFAEILRNFTFFFLLLDILLNFNTGYYNKGSLVLNYKKIAKKYVRNSFVLDVVSFIPVALEFKSGSDFSLKWLFFLRMLDFFKILSKIEESVHINFKLFHILGLLKVLARIVLLSHIFACGWHYISYINLSTSSNNWLSFYQMASETWWKRYISSYYFVCVTMNTVGYGDYTPQNDTERIFCIIFIYIACGVFAYTLNTIGTIIQQISKNKSHFLQNVMIINEFMNQKKIPLNLRMRIRKYLEYVWQHESETSQEASKIVEKLSNSLKDELIQETSGKILEKLAFFMEFSAKTRKKLMSFLKETHYMPGDLVFRRAEREVPCIFFVNSGEIRLFLEDTQQTLEKLRSGQCFGEREFILGVEPAVSAKSCAFSTVFALKFEDFEKVLAQTPEDWQKFCEIRDKARLCGEWQGFARSCGFCSLSGHFVAECPDLHYISSKTHVLRRFCHYEPVMTRVFKERRKGKRNARRTWTSCRKKAEVFCEKHAMFSFEELESKDFEESQGSARILREILRKNREFLGESSCYEEEKEESRSFCEKKSENSSEIEHFFLKNSTEEVLREEIPAKIVSFRGASAKNIKITSSLARNEEKKQKIEDTFFKEFEKPQEFLAYFPHNNIENVVRNYNEICEKILAKSPSLKKNRRRAANFSNFCSESIVSREKIVKKSAFAENFEENSQKNREIARKSLDRGEIIKLLRRRKWEKREKSLKNRVFAFLKGFFKEEE